MRLVLVIALAVLCFFSCSRATTKSDNDVTPNDGDEVAVDTILANDDALVTDEILADDPASPDSDMVGSDVAFPDEEPLWDDSDFVPYTDLRFVWELVREALPAEDTTLFPSRANAAAVSFDGHIWLLGGTDHHDVWRSADGKVWTEVADAIEPSIVGNGTVVIHDGKLWAVTDEGVWNSADGIAWTLLTAEPDFCKRTGFSLISWQDALWLVGGRSECADGGELWRSTDGVAWERKGHFTIEPTLPEGDCTMSATGIVGAAIFAQGDEIHVLGGHFTGGCYLEQSPPSGSPYGSCFQTLYLYHDEERSFGADGSEVGVIGMPIPETLSMSAALPYKGKYWLFGGKRYLDDSVTFWPSGGGGSYYECQEWPAEPKPHIYSSSDGLVWEHNGTPIPVSVMADPVIIGHGDAVWIIGSFGTNEVWRGAEKEVTVTTPFEAECDKGVYPIPGEIKVATAEDLEALHGFTSIGSLVIVSGIPDILALRCLQEIDSLTIRDSSLHYLRGLNSLTTVNGSIYIRENEFLRTTDSLVALRTVKGDMNISQNPYLTRISLPALTAISGVNISSCLALKSIMGIPGIDALTSLNVNLSKLPELVYWEPFGRLVKAGSIRFDEVRDMGNFPYLEEVETLSLIDISSPSTHAFPKLRWVNDSLAISGAKDLPTSFPLLEHVGGSVSIYNCSGFDGVEIFPLLSEAESVNMGENSVETLAGFASLKGLTGQLRISSHPTVKQVTAFSSLISVWSLDFANDIPSFSGLGALKHVDYFVLWGNANIVSLNSFASLRELGKNFRIDENASLSDISLLKQIESFEGGSITIANNPSLATCAAEEVADHFINDLGADPAKITIEGNNDELTCE